MSLPVCGELEKVQKKEQECIVTKQKYDHQKQKVTSATSILQILTQSVTVKLR